MKKSKKKMDDIRKKGTKKCQMFLFIIEIAKGKMQREHKNNILLVQLPQFCDKICKLAKVIEKRKVQMFPKQNRRNLEFNKSMNKLENLE